MNLEKKGFDLQTIYDASKDLGSFGDIQEIMENLLMMAIGNLGALSGVILIVDNNRNKIESIVQRGMENSSFESFIRFIQSESFLELQRTKGVQIIGDGINDQQKHEKGMGDILSSFNINIWTSFTINENLSGGIGLGDKMSKYPYNKDDEEVFSILSNQGALAIRNIKSTHLREKENALNRHLQEKKDYQYSHVIGKCKKMRKLLKEVEDLSKADNHVTIIGEKGTGKELLARKIHSDSSRTKFPIVEFEIPKERRKKKVPVQNERRKRENVACELFGTEKDQSLGENGTSMGYLSLVDNGTLIIKNIENMSSSTQEKILEFLETKHFLRIGGVERIFSNVRIIVTTQDIGCVEKKLIPKLLSLLTTHTLEVPHLSGRKKDIPPLMKHFVGKISKAKHIQEKRFSKEATNKLLRYDYPGNVDELEHIIERAVQLSNENAVIEEEVIFLGDTDVENKIRFNLLNISLVKKVCESRKIFLVAKIASVVFFVFILCFLLIKPDLLINGKNLILILCWQLAFPLLFLSLLFSSRFVCGVCPMYTISRFFNRSGGLRIPIPAFVKKHGFLIMGIGFITILFLEEFTHMAYSTTKTAYLIFSVFLCTIIFDSLFEKAAWCRYLCPLGGLNGLFGMSSFLEIRANRNTCTTVCTTHDCFKGTESSGPCPMFLHLQFLSDNRNCKFCLNCIKNCKHNATRLNLRIPGAEIASLKEPSLTGALLSIALCGLLIAKMYSRPDMNNANFPFVFFISTLFAFSLSFVSNYIASSITRGLTTKYLKHFGYTLLPIALCGFIALTITEVFGDAKGSFMLFKFYELNFNVSYIVQSLFILFGLFITEYLIYRVVQDLVAQGKQILTLVIQGVVPFILAIVYISLLRSG